MIKYKDLPTHVWRPPKSVSPLTDVMVSKEEYELLQRIEKEKSININLKIK